MSWGAQWWECSGLKIEGLMEGQWTCSSGIHRPSIWRQGNRTNNNGNCKSELDKFDQKSKTFFVACAFAFSHPGRSSHLGCRGVQQEGPIFINHFKTTSSMPLHFPSLLAGSFLSGTVFLLVHQQVSYRNRLTYKWPLMGESWLPVLAIV